MNVRSSYICYVRVNKPKKTKKQHSGVIKYQDSDTLFILALC